MRRPSVPKPKRKVLERVKPKHDFSKAMHRLAKPKRTQNRMPNIKGGSKSLPDKTTSIARSKGIEQLSSRQRISDLLTRMKVKLPPNRRRECSNTSG